MADSNNGTDGVTRVKVDTYGTAGKMASVADFEVWLDTPYKTLDKDGNVVERKPSPPSLSANIPNEWYVKLARTYKDGNEAAGKITDPTTVTRFGAYLVMAVADGRLKVGKDLADEFELWRKAEADRVAAAFSAARTQGSAAQKEKVAKLEAKVSAADAQRQRTIDAVKAGIVSAELAASILGCAEEEVMAEAGIA